MSQRPVQVTFYHSAICPRCHLAGVALRGILRDRPQFELVRIEMLTNRARARGDGVTMIPALVAGDRKLSGFLLTPARITRFLDSLLAERAPA